MKLSKLTSLHHFVRDSEKLSHLEAMIFVSIALKFETSVTYDRSLYEAYGYTDSDFSDALNSLAEMDLIFNNKLTAHGKSVVSRWAKAQSNPT